MEFRPTQAARDCQSCKRWCETNSKADSTSAAKEAQEPKWSFRPDPAKHEGRKLRPGEAGLSWRRTDAGADAFSARARTEGNNRSAPTPLECAGLPAHVTREAPYPTPERKRSFRSVNERRRRRRRG